MEALPILEIMKLVSIPKNDSRNCIRDEFGSSPPITPYNKIIHASLG